MQSKEHWERVYAGKAVDAVSWFQERAELSLRLIRGAGVPKTASIIDVGGGASSLVDDLLQEGYSDLTVLDLSATALSAARSRLGSRARAVTWRTADIIEAILPFQAYDIWHDRAVFHFLTSLPDRRAYVHSLVRAIKPGGHLIVATFSEEGPTQCSGLPVVRYSAESLHAAFGDCFSLIRQGKEEHRTPSGGLQPFVYCHFRANVL